MSQILDVNQTQGLLGGRIAGNSPAARRERPYRIVVHGLRHFCQKLPTLVGDENWDVRDRSRHTPAQLARLVRELRRCDLLFNWAGRIDMGHFLRVARTLRVPKVVTLWCGSDVLRAQRLAAATGTHPWIARHVHWAASPILAQEVRAIGLPCEYVQVSFVDVIRKPKPLPKQFSVLVFLPRSDAAELYGWDRVVEVATALPTIRFTLVGLHEGQSVKAPTNVTVQRWKPDITSAYEESAVLWRPVRHDAGISFMVLEALSHGRHVLYTYAMPGAVQVRDSEQAIKQLESLRALHDSGCLRMNYEGMEIVEKTYTRDFVRRELQRRWEEVICS
jgi:hypothetical protein